MNVHNFANCKVKHFKNFKKAPSFTIRHWKYSMSFWVVKCMYVDGGDLPQICNVKDTYIFRADTRYFINDEQNTYTWRLTVYNLNITDSMYQRFIFLEIVVSLLWFVSNQTCLTHLPLQVAELDNLTRLRNYRSVND
jgi:hypothetical protein